LNWDRNEPLLLREIPLESHLKNEKDHQFYFARPTTLKVNIGDPKSKVSLATLND